MNKAHAHTIINTLAHRAEVDGITVVALDQPILIGDVLQKIQQTMPRHHSGEISVYEDVLFKVLGAWENCGSTKSLQQIMEDSVWDEDDINAEIQYKPARALFEFLKTIFNQ